MVRHFHGKNILLDSVFYYLINFQVIYGSDVTVPVASSTFLEPGYEPLKGRYKVTVTEDDPGQDNFTFRLTIEGKLFSSGLLSH